MRKQNTLLARDLRSLISVCLSISLCFSVSVSFCFSLFLSHSLLLRLCLGQECGLLFDDSGLNPVNICQFFLLYLASYFLPSVTSQTFRQNTLPVHSCLYQAVYFFRRTCHLLQFCNFGSALVNCVHEHEWALCLH